MGLALVKSLSTPPAPVITLKGFTDEQLDKFFYRLRVERDSELRKLQKRYFVYPVTEFHGDEIIHDIIKNRAYFSPQNHQ